MPARMIRKLWRLLLLLLLMFIILIVRRKNVNLSSETLRDDWVPVGFSWDQKEYVDSRGVHVVGNVGDSSNNENPNLTDEVINVNNFSPIPHEGKDGRPVIIPPHLFGKMRQFYHINHFNLVASDRIPLNRTLRDVRGKKCRGKYTDIIGLPKTSIIIVFHNEAWSTLLRTVWSVINRSPHSLLQEIILVDDASTRKFLGKELDDNVKTLPVPTRVLRTGKRVGLIRARLQGANESKGHILTFLDSHCECTTGWLEALVIRVAEDRTRIVCPFIDIISDDTFAYIRDFELHWGGFNWDLQFMWYTISGDQLKKRKEDITVPFRTPAMAGGLFAMDKNYFFEIGAYDDKMEVWGGENLELSFRVWQCGGSVEIAPCSHVGHLFRTFSPYSFPGGAAKVLYRNLARVALVWMDEWKDFFFKFHPEADIFRDKLSIKSRLQLKKQLGCRNFKWYLDNVWPQHFFPTDRRFFGMIKNAARGECLQRPYGRGTVDEPMGPIALYSCAHKPILQQMFVSPFATSSNSDTNGPIATDESLCLNANDKAEPTDGMIIKVKGMVCNEGVGQLWKYDAKSKIVRHDKTRLCLDLPADESPDPGLVLNPCNINSSSQKWIFEAVPWRWM